MSSKVPTLLLVAAHGPELDGLLPLLGPERAATIDGLAVRAFEVGIGVAAAASQMSRLLCETDAVAALFVGTAGAYDGHALAVGSVIVAGDVVLASSAVAEARGAYPAPMPTRASADVALRSQLLGTDARARLVDVATTLAVTTDDALASTLARRFACAAEHLEAAAVGIACQAAGVPFAVVLGIANRVGATGREEWRRHHHDAGLGATQLVSSWLTAPDGARTLRTWSPGRPRVST